MTYLESAAGRIPMPQSRYILPEFEERTSYGFKRHNPYTKLFEDRIVFLGVQVDDASADDIMAQLLVLESQDPDRDITMYINSPGGSFTALTAIYDTMQYIKPQIQTVCLGQAASAAAVLLAAGAKGKRLALPNARVLIHQPATGGGGSGQASDIEIQAKEIMREQGHRSRQDSDSSGSFGIRSNRSGPHLTQGLETGSTSRKKSATRYRVFP
jgi:ATP-dependent Clp protease, protease subunit